MPAGITQDEQPRERQTPELAALLAWRITQHSLLQSNELGAYRFVISLSLACWAASMSATLA